MSENMMMTRKSSHNFGQQITKGDSNVPLQSSHKMMTRKSVGADGVVESPSPVALADTEASSVLPPRQRVNSSALHQADEDWKDADTWYSPDSEKYGANNERCDKASWLDAIDRHKLDRGLDDCKEACEKHPECRAIFFKWKKTRGKKKNGAACQLYKNCEKRAKSTDKGNLYAFCRDSSSYKDPVWPGGCKEWEGWDCSEKSRMSAAQVVTLKKACPKACLVCKTCSADHLDGLCPKYKYCESGSCVPEPCSSLHQTGVCPSGQICNLGTCCNSVDDPAYTDPVFGGDCSGWEGYNCETNDNMNMAQIMDLKDKCARTCKVCSV